MLPQARAVAAAEWERRTPGSGKEEAPRVVMAARYASNSLDELAAVVDEQFAALREHLAAPHFQQYLGGEGLREHLVTWRDLAGLWLERTLWQGVRTAGLWLE